ncbi:MAG: YtxH domain-containing protein [Candidatus Solibacter usitatus]|nr:YtxH domain-containing protein [Candidatus Solibacter usitatus]
MDRDGLANFVLGVGVGVVVGLLFAPKTGEETRELLKSKADEGKEYLKKRGSELRVTAEEVLERGRDVVGRQKDTLAEAVAAGKQAYRETVHPAEASEAPAAR